MNHDFVYTGTELEIFALANHWKGYWSEIVANFLGKRVLDVGAGTGSTAKQLASERQETWVALEPDAGLAERMFVAMRQGLLPNLLDVRVGTIRDLAPTLQFDTILYIDVLEHISDDRSELRDAFEHLETGGHLIVLAPAHQSLFTPFDKAIGHYRRYSRAQLLDIAPPGLALQRAMYLDSVGLLASLANRFLLRSATPTRTQVKMWDNYMVPVSRFVDPMARHHLGKSVLAVWSKR